jgi:FkbM family methyltransferase
MMKKFIKSIVKSLPVNLTKNQKYDAQTKKIFQRVLKSDSVFVDVGCHKGEVLDWAIKYAPKGRHFGFEAIPQMAADLKTKYLHHTIYNTALSDNKGTISFHHVVSNPAFSGINKRTYTKVEEIQLIEVEADTLDNVLPMNQRVSLIKIDVEGGEYGVLNGAKETIKREKPIIVFEHGLGASEYYENSPEKMWELLHSQLKMNISLMKNYLSGKQPLSREQFIDQYQKKLNYYFVAYP